MFVLNSTVALVSLQCFKGGRGNRCHVSNWRAPTKETKAAAVLRKPRITRTPAGAPLLGDLLALCFPALVWGAKSGHLKKKQRAKVLGTRCLLT